MLSFKCSLWHPTQRRWHLLLETEEAAQAWEFMSVSCQKEEDFLLTLSSPPIQTMSTSWEKVYKHIDCVCTTSSGLIMVTFPALWQLPDSLLSKFSLSPECNSLTFFWVEEGVQVPHPELLAFGYLFPIFPQSSSEGAMRSSLKIMHKANCLKRQLIASR